MAVKFLARARAGEITGWMHTVSGPDGVETSICGDFSEDPDYAADAANEAFEFLLGRKADRRLATSRDTMRRRPSKLPLKIARRM